MAMTELSVVYVCLVTTLAMAFNYVKIITRYTITVNIYIHYLI